MNKKKIYGPLARFLRAGVRPFLHRWDTSGAQKAQPPAVYVVHHRNMSGPVHTLALLPDEPRPWVLHVFLDRHECFAQYYGYTFRKRFGWPAPAAWAAAGVLSLAVPAVVRSFGAIPVYRSLKETRDMMEQSAQALLRGESIMLCPDVAYDSAAPATGEIDRPDGGKILLSVAGAADAVLCGRVGGVHRAAHGRHAGQAAGGRASGRGQLPGAASLGVQ